MSENENTIEHEEYGDLTDFVVGATKNTPLDIQVSIEENNNVVLFHNKPFKHKLSWYEFDISSSKLDFVLEDGQTRDIGIALNKDVSKYMQNAHQVLTVHVDDESGEAVEAVYIPLIIHGN